MSGNAPSRDLGEPLEAARDIAKLRGMAVGDGKGTTQAVQVILNVPPHLSEDSVAQYIKNFIARMRGESLYAAKFFEELKKELDRLDPRDFEPSVQHDIVWARAEIEYAVSPGVRTEVTDMRRQALFQTIENAIDHYRGEGSRAVLRSFPYVHKRDIRRIIERDYAELRLKLLPTGAWKSCVVLAGSVLEALLLDVLSHRKRVAATNKSPKGARAKGGIPLPISSGEWKLSHLINVAVDTDVLPKERADTIDQVLRDYRNFVHPEKELSAGYPCNEAEAFSSIGALEGVCNHFDSKLT